jgi:hypothetical protein
MNPTLSRTAAVLASFVTALFIAACSGPSSDAHSEHGQGSTPPLITEQPAGYNADDIAFATPSKCRAWYPTTRPTRR